MWFSLLCVMGVNHHYHVCSMLGTGVDGGGSTNGSTTPPFRSRTVALMSTLHAPPTKEATASSFFGIEHDPSEHIPNAQLLQESNVILRLQQGFPPLSRDQPLLSDVTEVKGVFKIRNAHHPTFLPIRPCGRSLHIHEKNADPKRLFGAQPQPPKPSTAT